MTPVLTRRTVLAGLAMTALSACADGPDATMTSRSMTEPDPLARFRLFAESGPDVWERHLQPPNSKSGLRVLSLSGGGEDGAFGAGVLAGWTVTGTGPDFDMVTGISTGALIAPFAFLGPEQDDALRRIFTQHDAGDIMKLHP